MKGLQTVFRIEKSITIATNPKGSAIIENKRLDIGGDKRKVLQCVVLECSFLQIITK